MRTLILAATAALALAGVASAKPCRDPATHRFVKCPVAVAATPAPAVVKAPVAVGVHHPDCVKGKLCGNSCIAKADVCHKPG